MILLLEPSLSLTMFVGFPFYSFPWHIYTNVPHVVSDGFWSKVRIEYEIPVSRSRVDGLYSEVQPGLSVQRVHKLNDRPLLSAHLGPWYHGRLDRIAAEMLLIQNGTSLEFQDGLFLLRDTQSDPEHMLCLSVLHGHKVLHNRIRRTAAVGFQYLGPGHQHIIFDTIDDLIWDHAECNERDKDFRGSLRLAAYISPV